MLRYSIAALCLGAMALGCTTAPLRSDYVTPYEMKSFDDPTPVNVNEAHSYFVGKPKEELFNRLGRPWRVIKQKALGNITTYEYMRGQKAGMRYSNLLKRVIYDERNAHCNSTFFVDDATGNVYSYRLEGNICEIPNDQL